MSGTAIIRMTPGPQRTGHRCRLRGGTAIVVMLLQLVLPVIHAHPPSAAHDAVGLHLPGTETVLNVAPLFEAEFASAPHAGDPAETVFSVGPALGKRADATGVSSPASGIPAAAVAFAFPDGPDNRATPQRDLPYQRRLPAPPVRAPPYV